MRYDMMTDDDMLGDNIRLTRRILLSSVDNIH